MLLQVSALLSNKGHRVLYISGEESIRQTKLRAERLGVVSQELYIYSETNLELLNQTIDDVQPKFVIVDSIQTVFHPEVTSAPGSVSQVRECTAELMRIAKTKGIAIFFIFTGTFTRCSRFNNRGIDGGNKANFREIQSTCNPYKL
ncbi:DNA repair protein RadA [Lysinibacillus sphaericus]